LIVSRSRNDQKGSRAKERRRKKSIVFRNDSIIESREVVHGRRNTSIALSLKADTKEAVKEQKGLPPTLDSSFFIFFIFLVLVIFVVQRNKRKTNSYHLPTTRTGAEGKINLRDSFRN